MIYQKALYHMVVVDGADFQMFVLCKETRDPFNLSHFTRERMLKSRDHNAPINGGNRTSDNR